VESGDALTIGMGLYLVSSFALHRVRLARLRKYGLELDVVSRLAPSLPPEAGPVLAAIERARQAREKKDEGAVENEAHAALAEVRKLGGTKREAWLAYLDAHVRLTYLANATNLELVCITVLIGLNRALARFGPSPLLHLALAHAQTLFGQLNAAVHELGRAAYYANGDTFFLKLVLDSSYVEVARPVLHQQCEEWLAKQAER
jgi:hypothetical protein